MSGFRVELTTGAEQDLEELVDHLARHGSEATAERLLDQLLVKIGSLEAFPGRGSYPGELEALGIRSYRQLNFGVYRLIYRVSGKIVHVVLIADGRRDIAALLQRRLLAR